MVCVVDGWGWRRGGLWRFASWRAVIPDGLDPLEFDWSWVAGCDVFVIAAKTDRVIEIMRALRETRYCVGLAVADGRIIA